MVDPRPNDAEWAAISRLEKLRNSRVLVLVAITIDRDILPALYEACRAMGVQDRLDVVLVTRGGVVNDARRIGLLLRSMATHLSFIVPHHCESSGTLLALAGDEIVAGDLAIFSPIDPHLSGETGAAATSSLSWLDVTTFPEMAHEWFGVEPRAAGIALLRLLCGSVSAHALTMFYRISLEMQATAMELLAHPMRHVPLEARRRIVAELMGGRRSHDYAFTGSELAQLGVAVVRDPLAADAAWVFAKRANERMGGANRVDGEWCDVLVATRGEVRTRLRSAGGAGARWHRSVP
ncbi:MAG: SDH family Clp fold serine proteinase [Dokdonella sp.]|uniref:SDH family Clp fold serine proteinase n=1 Tax=Dokdonella sp. TaxID=2291710 RepID=UPI003F7E349C